MWGIREKVQDNEAKVAAKQKWRNSKIAFKAKSSRSMCKMGDLDHCHSIWIFTSWCSNDAVMVSQWPIEVPNYSMAVRQRDNVRLRVCNTRSCHPTMCGLLASLKTRPCLNFSTLIWWLYSNTVLSAMLGSKDEVAFRHCCWKVNH